MKKLLAVFLLLLLQIPLLGSNSISMEFEDYSSGTRYAVNSIPNPSQVGTDQNAHHNVWWRAGVGLAVAGEYGLTGTGIGANLVTSSDRTASAAYTSGVYIFFNTPGVETSGLTLTSSRYITYADGDKAWTNMRLVIMRPNLYANSAFVHNESLLENTIIDARNKTALLHTLSSGPTNGYVSNIISSGIKDNSTHKRTDFYLGKEKHSLNGAALQYPSRAYYTATSYENSYLPGYGSTADNMQNYDIPVTLPQLKVLDATAPTIAFSPNSRGWANTNVTVDITASDNVGVTSVEYRTRVNSGSWSNWSGSVANGTDVTFSTTGTHQIEAYAKDARGNEVYKTSGSFQIDKVAPTIAFSPNSRGWSNANASLSITASDNVAVSNVQYRYLTNGSTWSGWTTITNGSSITFSSTGTFQVQAYAKDSSGNETYTTSGNYQVDKVAPVTSFSPNSRGWSNANAVVTINSTDNIAQDVIYYRTSTNDSSWSGWVLSSAGSSVTFSSTGKYQLNVDSYDSHGNASNTSSGFYYVDKTAPPTPTINRSRTGWGNTAATFTLTGGSDAHSGFNRYGYSIAGGTWTGSTTGGSVTVAQEGEIEIRAVNIDNVENWSGQVSTTVKNDYTDPSVTVSSTNYTLGKSNRQIGLTYNDNLSGLSIKQYKVTSSTTAPTSGWLDYSSAIDLTTTGDHYIHYNATDGAGNNKKGYFGPYRIDKDAPSISASPASRAWSNAGISVVLSYSDIGSGINSATREYAWSTSTAVPTTWTAAPASNTVAQTGDGIWYLHARVTDNAGNTRTTYFGSYQKEVGMPVIGASPTSRPWSNAGISVDLSFTDTVSGINSGTRQYAWSTSTAVPTTWTAVPVSNTVTHSTDGIWYLHTRVTDNAGNTTTTHFGTYQKDAVLPVISANPTNRPWSNAGISVDLTFTDDRSGIDAGTRQYAWSTSTAVPTTWTAVPAGNTVTQTADGNWYLHTRVTDNAGNTRTTYFGTYQKDAVLPVIGASPSSRSWSNAGISVVLSFTDARSGIDAGTRQYAWSTSTAVPTTWTAVPADNTLTQTTDETWYLHARVTDNAGNTRTTYFGPYRKEVTPPTIMPDIGTRPWSNQDISVSLNFADAQSGIDAGSREYAWSTSTAVPTTWTAVPINNIVIQTNDGVWYLHARVTDNAGNTRTTYFGPYRKEETLPNISVSSGSRPWSNQDVSVTLLFSDSHSGINAGTRQYAWSTSTAVPTTWTAVPANNIVTQSSNGVWYLHARVTDNAGNTRTFMSGDYRVDKIMPTITFTPNGRVHTHAYNVGVAIADSTSGVKSIKYVTNSSTTKPTSWSAGSLNFSIGISVEGVFYIHVEVEDIAGNIRYIRSNALVLDNKAPTISVSHNPNPTMIHGDTGVSLRITDVEMDKTDLNYALYDPLGNKVSEYSHSQLISGTTVGFNFTPTIPGLWQVRGNMVDLFESNYTTFTYNIPVLDAGITGRVIHTDLWEHNRQKFNIFKTGDPEAPRTPNYFFAGEKFLVEADVLNTYNDGASIFLAESVEVQIKGTAYKADLTRVSGDLWVGEIWDYPMLTWKDRVLEFDFIVTYKNGYQPSETQTITINSDSYFRMKQGN